VEGLHPWWPPALPAHPHPLFELAGWSVAWRCFLADRARRDPVGDPLLRATLLTAGVVGGGLGAWVSFLAEDPVATWARRADPSWLLSGRSVLGALLGAWGAVEVAKRRLGVAAATGDAYVRGLGYGLAVGRLGCFFSGVTDGTHGLPTGVPWGMDLGDGVPRHPTALYDAAVAAGLAAAVGRLRWRADGQAFLAWLGGYLAWRLGVEAWKPGTPVLGPFTGLQLQALAGLVACGVVAARRWARPPTG
jgi:phosphatidylglycerol:prolipoprotein diacylglycerol transferase